MKWTEIILAFFKLSAIKILIICITVLVAFVSYLTYNEMTENKLVDENGEEMVTE